MAENQDGQEKTEKATAKRREEAVKEGNVAKSTDLGSVAVLFAGILALQFVGGDIINAILEIMRYIYFNLSSIDVSPATLRNQTIDTFIQLAPSIIPLLLLLIIAGLAVNIAQVGFVIASKAIQPKFSKISPLSGIKRLFSLRSIVELFKGLLKMTIVAYVGYRVLQKHFDEFWLLANMTVFEMMGFMAKILFELTIKIAAVMIVVAFADYAYQRYEHEKMLKMTKQEVKDENKQYENPEIKGRIRSIQRSLSRKRMMQAVPSATVVVTNPTHIAIALRYEPKNKGDAPMCVAKGKRKLAEQIKKIAMENNIPIIENKPLAWQLYDVLEPGVEIPFVFYQAVAEILAKVYAMRNENPF